MKSLEELRAIRTKMQGKVGVRAKMRTRSVLLSEWRPAGSQAERDRC